MHYDGEGSRLSFLKRDLTVNINNLFKLGQEGKYRGYVNQYSTNVLALNKHQHREDHDKRRHLSHKFSLTTASEFKWNGSIYGSRSVTVCTLRLTIIQLENSVPGPFMHPNWASHRYNSDPVNVRLFSSQSIVVDHVAIYNNIRFVDDIVSAFELIN